MSNIGYSIPDIETGNEPTGADGVGDVSGNGGGTSGEDIDAVRLILIQLAEAGEIPQMLGVSKKQTIR